MNIEFFAPLQNSIERMKNALFRPFDLNKWFAVGFTAFLASLLEGNGGNKGTQFGNSDHGIERISDIPRVIGDWISAHGELFTLIVVGGLLLMAFLVLLAWLSSRGKFMFLYNVVNNDKLVKKPWNEFRDLGNSLFVWRLIFGFATLFVILLFLYVGFSRVAAYEYFDEVPIMGLVVPGVLFFLVLMVIIGYVSLFLDAFIVPIMYKRRVSATEAWSIFLPLMKSQLGYFILFGLFVFVIILLVVAIVLAVGFGTCCIGFLLIMIPYIGSILLLPISYSLRGLGPDFLAQFGDEWDIFPKPELGNGDVTEETPNE